MSVKSSHLTVNLGFGTTLLILACLIASCLLSARSFVNLKSERKLARLRSLQLRELWIGVESAESAQRGYLLIHDEGFAASFGGSRQSKRNAVEALRRLYAPDAPAQADISSLDELLERKFDEMAETVRIAGSGNIACALAIVRSGYGYRLINEARAEYDAMKNHGEQEIERLRAEGDALLSRGFWTVGFACLLAMAALLAAIAVVNADIARRHRNEVALRAANLAAQQATGAKSIFLATMSHELRTPLNAICGMSDFLLEGPLEAEQRKFAEVIARSARALLSLVNDILDFSKIEAGKLSLESTVFAPESLFKSQLDIVRHLAETKGLQLIYECDANVPGWLRGDPGRIGQVILNLLSNALKFTPAGSVTARFSAQPDIDAGMANLRAEIIDTGIGLSDEQMSRLFRPFSQVHGAAQASYGGTGLGLAICRQLVDLMGGSIGVRRNPEGGSTFWISVRLSVPDQAAITAATMALHPLAAAANGALQGTTPLRGSILVAEDNAVNQLLITKQLERLGYRSQVVQNGTEALTALNHSSFDLVLMDCQMPEMDGYEAARRIRDTERQSGKRVPIIALTASAVRGDAERCVEAGMDGHLTKPVSKDLLAQTIKVWMPQR